MADTALFALTDGGNVFQFSIETGALLGDFDTEFTLPQFLAMSPDGASLAHGSRWSDDSPEIPHLPAAKSATARRPQIKTRAAEG